MSYERGEFPPAIISRHWRHDELPEKGPRVRGKSTNRGHKARLLVGWRHQDDTQEALLKGRIWCWVGVDKFQVYDETYNRSDEAGVVRFCGPANFTMVRMFHPWFAMGGYEVPNDMVSEHKKYCRDRYREAMQEYKLQERAAGIDSDDDDDGEDQSTEDEAQLDYLNNKRTKSNGANRSYGRKGGTEPYPNQSDNDFNGTEDEMEDDDDGLDNHNTFRNRRTSVSNSNDHPRGESSSHSRAATNSLSDQFTSNASTRIKKEHSVGCEMPVNHGNSFGLDHSDLTIITALRTYHDSQSNHNVHSSSPEDVLSRIVSPSVDAGSGALFIPDSNMVNHDSTSTDATVGEILERSTKRIKREGEGSSFAPVKLEADKVEKLRSHGAKNDPVELDSNEPAA